jgi:quercetin dioxygenase-like cupin family protein
MPAPGTLITSTTVSRGRFDEIGLTTTGSSDIYVVTNTIAPGGDTGWHAHPGPSLITVQSGTVTAYEGDDPSCTPRVHQAGSGFIEPGHGHAHLLRNEGDVDVVTVAVQIIPADSERRTDVATPGNCAF